MLSFQGTKGRQSDDQRLPSMEVESKGVFREREQMLDDLERLRIMLDDYTDAIACFREIQFFCESTLSELNLILKEKAEILMTSSPWGSVQQSLSASEDKLKEIRHTIREADQELKELIDSFESKCPQLRKTAENRELDPVRDGVLEVARDLCIDLKNLKGNSVDMIKKSKENAKNILEDMADLIRKIRRWIEKPEENAQKENEQSREWRKAQQESADRESTQKQGPIPVEKPQVISPEDVEFLKALRERMGKGGISNERRI